MINRMMFAALVATLGIGSAIAQPTASEPPKCEPFPPDPPQQIACLRQTVDSLKTVIGTLQTELESLQQQITIELGTAVKKGQPVNLVHRQSNINIDECLTGGLGTATHLRPAHRRPKPNIYDP